MTTEPDSKDEPFTLATIPGKYAQPPAESLAKLPKPYSKDSQKGKCDECGGFHGLPAMHLDYMGHADVTLALIAIDPEWSWEPLGVDADGAPAIQVRDRRLVMWANLTILGKTMRGVGTCAATKDDPEKELIGDFLRNAAMRFGIGTRLWSKAAGESADPFGSGESGGFDRQAPRQQQQTSRPATGQGRAAPARNQGGGGATIPEYVAALMSKLDKPVAYVLAIARPIARGYSLPEPTNAGQIGRALCATVADKMNVDPTDIGLSYTDVLRHDDQPGHASEPETQEVEEDVLQADLFAGATEVLHAEWCTQLHRNGEPCDEEPF